MHGILIHLICSSFDQSDSKSYFLNLITSNVFWQLTILNKTSDRMKRLKIPIMGFTVLIHSQLNNENYFWHQINDNDHMFWNLLKHHFLIHHNGYLLFEFYMIYQTFLLRLHLTKSRNFLLHTFKIEVISSSRQMKGNSIIILCIIILYYFDVVCANMLVIHIHFTTAHRWWRTCEWTIHI